MSNQYFISASEPIPVDPIHPAEVLRVIRNAAPTANDKNFLIGTQWVDQSTGTFYGLASVDSSGATWSLLSPGASDVDTLTGDSGGAISPVAGNIDILGGTGITVVGTPGTLTINSATGYAPITLYVVDGAGGADYTTIQAALDAADGAGGGAIWVRPGTYTEDLTLYDATPIIGAQGPYGSGTVTIAGTHTPPNSGAISFANVTLSDATTIVSSAAAGTTTVTFENCQINVTNGYCCDLVSWTGALSFQNCAFGGTTDGISNNTGGSDLSVYNSNVGAGSGNAWSIAGALDMQASIVNCPMSLVTGATGVSINASSINAAVTLGNDSAGTITQTAISSGATASITMSSSGDWDWDQLSIDSSANPAIAGAGAGTVTYGVLTFLNGSNMASTLTTSPQETRTGTSFATTFDTDVAAAGVTLTGTTLAADGTDANIGITVTTKGTGTLALANGTAGVAVTMANGINTVAQSVTIAGGAAGADSTVSVLSGNATAGTQTLNLATGGRAKTVNVATGVDGNTVNVATGINTAAQTVNISTGAAAADSTVNILSGIATAGTQTANIASAASAATVNLGTGAGVKTVTIGSTDTTSATTINAGSGGITLAGDVDVSTGFLDISAAAKTLRVEGGAATDFVGTVTLTNGVGTVANTNIAAGDIILLSRTSIGASPAIGQPVVTISAGNDFTVTSVDAAGATETDDASVFAYFIVRPL